MSVLLGLLLGAALCPQVLGLPEATARTETGTQEDKANRTLERALSLAPRNADFAFSLYKVVAAQSPEKNVIFSPLSLSMALALLALGARGPTQTDILQGLKFNLTETPGADIHQGFRVLLRHLSRPEGPLHKKVSTAMFVDQRLNLQGGFQEQAWALYAADAVSTDFQDPAAAKKLINDYVEQKTQGKIRDLVKDLDAKTRMFLVNCLYFNATWKTPFRLSDTSTADFYVSKNKTVQVPMMFARGMSVPFLQDETLGCAVVQLPYEDSSTCALLILPDEGHMAEVEAALLPATLQRWRDSMTTRKVTLNLPKFSISGDYDLEQVLSELGLGSIFSQQADLSGITEDQKLSVSQVVHKATMDVSEEGTEGFAASGLSVLLKSPPRDIVTVRFNRPFLLAIVTDDTQSILFVGKVIDPQQA